MTLEQFADDAERLCLSLQTPADGILESALPVLAVELEPYMDRPLDAPEHLLRRAVCCVVALGTLRRVQFAGQVARHMAEGGDPAELL